VVEPNKSYACVLASLARYKRRHARGARVIFLCEVSEIRAFMELFTVSIWLI